MAFGRKKKDEFKRIEPVVATAQEVMEKQTPTPEVAQPVQPAPQVQQPVKPEPSKTWEVRTKSIESTPIAYNTITGQHIDSVWYVLVELLNRTEE